ncbi:MAG TPA: Hpt domain-containing protein [Candidatus Synoicihabitans sp.]|nr:Hpt domain-containing protein [Candidatus Synoicihabitans sp.]
MNSPDRLDGCRPLAAVLDTDRLANLVALEDGEDPQFLTGLITLFLSETPKRLAEIAAAQAAGDGPMLARVAHTLKGACATLGADELQELSASLEACASRNELAKLAPTLSALDGAFARLEEALRLQQRRLQL